jgi:predicted nucleic acid-binding protein
MSPTNYLLDTNAISEAPKSLPNKGFITWLLTVDNSQLFTSCLVIGELKKGVALNTDNDRYEQLNGFLSQTIADLEERITNIDQETCTLWGQLIADGQRSGKTPPLIDALIAAQCIQHHMTLVTRNVKDFEQFKDLMVHCPWSDIESS